MIMKFRNFNMTNIINQSNKYNKEININSLSNNFIKILKRIQKILSQKIIKNEYKLNIQ